MCGKYNPSITLPNASIGSPRMCGKYSNFRYFALLLSDHPACAGSTVQLLVCPATMRITPHVREVPSIPTLDCI